MKNWLKALVKRKPESTEWKINIQYKQDFVSLEITDHPYIRTRNYHDLFVSILDQVFSDYNIAILSQLIGIGQGWDQVEAFETPQDYTASVKQRFGLDSIATSSYESSDPADRSTLYYVINVIGHFEPALLQELLGFGGDSLPNIAYCVDVEPEDWLAQTLEWNRTFVRWFWRKEADSTLKRKIIDHVKLLFFTSDGHLFFLLTTPEQKERIVAVVTNLANKHNLTLVIHESVK